MKKSSGNTRNILSEVNHILGIDDSYQAPDRVLALVTGGDRLERDRVYYELAELFGFDYSMDTLEELKEGGYLDE